MSNSPYSLRFRQVHLDFHTSPIIPGIGEHFDKNHWQQTLKSAAVDSITLFAKCHHGWSYHPTKVGKIHPHLDFDLLRKQYDATKEIGINAPIYLSAGVDNLASYDHPEWREINKDGVFTGWSTRILESGFHMMDFHSPYLDYLCEQIREVVQLFPDCDGIFLDIIAQHQSCSRWSLDFMKANGLDPACEADRKESSRLAVEQYYIQTTAVAKSLRQDMPIMHNSSHIYRGRHEVLPYFSHLELESLPTGGWGYDHFPLSAKYVSNLSLDFLGQTGKFHTAWGEFGGYKHPNALRYECAAMLAYGAKCSVGDQLHPNGMLDQSTYKIIGEAYREVEAKEPWCRGAKQCFDVAILSSEAEGVGDHKASADEGACRVLLEGHFLFGVVDRTMDFSEYKALLLPDNIRIDEALKEKLDAYIAQGGKLILSGESGQWKDRENFAFDIGADYEGLSPCFPADSERNLGHDYFLPVPELRASFVDMPQIMYERSHRIRAQGGCSLGQIFDPYFNRNWSDFNSHQHAPNLQESSGYDCGVKHGPILYFSHPVFRNYRSYGAVAYRHFIVNAIRSFLGGEQRLMTNMPSTGRASLTYQTDEQRYVLHLLYAPTVSRGGPIHLSLAEGKRLEIIEELPSLHGIEVSLRLAESIRTARLEPMGVDLPFERVGELINIKVPAFSCHQMIVLKS
ncbi:alpha-amylase family protein [Cerasicoccus arenae]|uniref:Beta-galactosidase trimerisation domain-containing protein n=1 Tax=Cerasicoccus arenae TaxID=424488 RepID=A0A8J3DGQ9_9BACT|nr:alpha-amylase family protein [Cerasicoccus arenae]MBK1858595.1 beta-galactosidase trimerization domain-containing protein [Cerasicoccus arenae]GHC05095.1 hypothetical protein GCM10007047_22570 [Cerasicoccus arenae]